MVNCMFAAIFDCFDVAVLGLCNGYKYESRACKKTMINALSPIQALEVLSVIVIGAHKYTMPNI